MNNIKISIIIPIFNHEKYIISCLQSVISQNYNPLEIIAIDDGSKDSSYELANEYLNINGGECDWVVNKRKNQGINKTLNECISMSTGQVIIPLASDDMMSSNSLSIVNSYLNKRNYKESLFFYDLATIKENGELIEKSVVKNIIGGSNLLSRSKLYLASRIILRWGMPFGQQLYAKEYFLKYGPYPEEVKYEDLHFALKSIVFDKCVFIPEVLKKYRVRDDGSITPGLKIEDLSTTKIRKSFLKCNIKITNILMLIAYLKSKKNGIINNYILYILSKSLQLIILIFSYIIYR